MIQDGVWTNDTPVAPTDASGNFQRAESGFRDWLTPDGRPGPDGQAGVPAERDRYHLYVSLACPWAHRTLVVRALKGLEDMLPVTVVGPLMGAQGWSFTGAFGGTGDPVNGADHLHQLYTMARPGMTGKVTVPVLWDKRARRIVNNEIVGDHPHAQHRVRRSGRARGQLLSAGVAGGDRCGERPGLFHRQQRRVPCRVRDDAGCV
ncbi:hypothetical protein [Sphingomonas hankookensis]|uniref:hypothetical protein n=1 Tax=Sphingomonas hankookensis TaxID=563996 RepID=UPI003D301F17